MKRFQVPVAEFTTPNPITAPETMTAAALNELMNLNQIRHVPIVKGGTVIGMVSDRDLRVLKCLPQAEVMQIQASDIMSLNPVAVTEDMLLDEVAYQMSKRKIGSVLVNQKDGSLLGIFTITDALNALVEIVRGTDESEYEKD